MIHDFLKEEEDQGAWIHFHGKQTGNHKKSCLPSELQIRGCIEHNSKIIFLISH